MSYEEPHVATRSASHGALNGSYSLPTRASSSILDSSHHLIPPFKPLRSIREHVHTFLDPAASADGMLRKTTETGNIGLFSIHTDRPTALRPRASLGDLRQPHRTLIRSSDKASGHADRKPLPSYRDSTSEIISMYGSDNQSSAKSLSGTLSPPWDDGGQRSYSMTTCGSKSFTLLRNMGMPQPHDAHAGAQRPRSPYPYPTRLPRPGIRPSSPALTENGHVDYSRMVEIDRVPQRTVHHPHKPLFPYKTTRDQPAPLSLRYGVNQSTGSLSEDRGPTRQVLPRTPHRPPLPIHLHPWGFRPRPRLGSESSNQSMRTMSLTSTNGGYGCNPPQVPRLQVPEKKPPIFYDYSEDFEDVVDPPPDFPIANPTPKRVSNSFRPGISDDGCDARSESTDEGVGHVVEYLRRMTMIESGEGQDESQDEDDQDEFDEDYSVEHYRPVSQLFQRESPTQPSCYEPAKQAIASRGSSSALPRFAHTVNKSYLSNDSLDDNQDAMDQEHTDSPNHITEVIANGLVSEASTLESALDPETPGYDAKLALADPACYDDDSAIPDHGGQHEGANDGELSDGNDGAQMALGGTVPPMGSKPDLPNGISATLPYRYSGGRKDSRLFSLNSGLSDLASFVKNVDKHMQALDHEQSDQDNTSIPALGSEPVPDHGRHYYQKVQEAYAPPRKSSLANQRRSYACPRVDNPAPVDELDRYQVVSTRSGPTLVPQPISPAKMLRLKNSIPQLMKALPPLPSYSPASESPFNPTLVPVEFEPFEFSRLTDARSTLIEAFDSQRQDKEAASEDYDPFAFDRVVSKPRLKLKTPASQPPVHFRRTRPRHLEKAEAISPETSGTRQSPTEGYSTAPVKRRLPIKVSRSTQDSLASEHGGTVKRRPGIDKSSTVSELAASQPLDLFSPSTALGMAIQNTRSHALEQPPQGEKEYGTLPVVKASPMVRIQRVTVNDEGRGASLDTQLNALHSQQAKTETATEDGMQSFFSDNLVKPQRGLRKRLSNLKSRLTEPRRHHRAPVANVAVCETKGHRPAIKLQSPPTIVAAHTGTSTTKAHHTVTPTRSVRSKWGKLVRGAKHRLRTWGKNRHKDE